MLNTTELTRKWTKSAMVLAFAYATLMTFGEIIALLYFQKFDLLKMPLEQYFAFKLVIPIFINVIALTLGSFLLDNKKLPIVHKGFIPLWVIGTISMNFIIFHSTVPICILALILPILILVLYSDSEIIKKVPFYCIFGTLLVAGILFYLNYDLGYEYIANLFISLLFLIGLIITAFIMASLEIEKNELLIASVKERDYYYDKAVIDGLTKSYNHASYTETINDNIKKYDNMVLAVIDIDNFKNVNDTYGHSNGNVVLKSLAKILNKINSEETYVARYGGEEFVILFFDEDINQAYKIIDKLKTKFSSIRFKELNNNNVTFSCGVAKKNSKSTPQTLFDAADKALYEAKNTGKNKIILAN